MADMGFLPAVAAPARRHARRPPDAAVLGHARRRRRRARPPLPARPRRATRSRRRGRPARRSTHRFWNVAARRPRRRSPPTIVDRRRPDHRVLPHQARRRPAGQAARARPACAAAAIHGDRSPGPARAGPRGVRRRARSHALVATDVAARGIHVDGVACVVHFDPPEDERLPAPLRPHRPGRRSRHRGLPGAQRGAVRQPQDAAQAGAAGRDHGPRSPLGGGPSRPAPSAPMVVGSGAQPVR